VPGSKSQTSRALVLAALATGPSLVRGVADSRDTQLMSAGLEALGTRVEDLGSGVRRVTPAPVRPVPAGIDCGLAGTVLRFLPPVAALAPGTTRFTGDERASERPLRPLLDGLAQLGVRYDSATGSVPFTLTSPAHLEGRVVVIDSSASSQFVSGLLLAAPHFPDGLDLRHDGPPIPSAPHIAMTVQMLRQRGVKIDDATPDRWDVRPGPIGARDELIEPDLTNAAAFLVAGVLSGGWVEVPDWPLTTTQPGDHIRTVLDAFGARTTLTPTGPGHGVVRAEWVGPPRGTHLDLHAASELTPVVAALGAFAEGDTTVSGVGHIRGHETDRIAAIVTTLGTIGVAAEETPDGLVIHGAGERPHALRGAILSTFGDHRMAHLGALVGLRIPGVGLAGIEATTKTLPDFPERWCTMVAGTGA